MDRNRINIQILDVKTNGLVDTGAAVSCISYDLVKKFENKVRLDRADIPNIYGVGGEKHKVKGKVLLNPKSGLVLIWLQGYWQIELHPNSRHKSAFVTLTGVKIILYKLRRMSDHKLLSPESHANRIKPYEDPRNVREPVRQLQNNDDLNDNSSQMMIA
ncbi:unnamed protein product [Mytilus edulis]|uniref:Peptidase A2 domain-containing protein n=1 Tax=Mytilus edulis TaxID=6550 RepID=A0A8S3PQS8_MYTED|nr:unnamed protein product [Mytilus edulis]